MRPAPTRDYRRNGILYKTVRGQRKKFGPVMSYYFKASLQMDGEHITGIITTRIRVFNESLNEESGLNYSISGVKAAQSQIEDYEQNLITIVITFKQLPQCYPTSSTGFIGTE